MIEDLVDIGESHGRMTDKQRDDFLSMVENLKRQTPSEIDHLRKMVEEALPDLKARMLVEYQNGVRHHKYKKGESLSKWLQACDQGYKSVGIETQRYELWKKLSETLHDRHDKGQE